MYVQVVNAIAMIENLIEKAIAIRTIVWHPRDPIGRTIVIEVLTLLLQMNAGIFFVFENKMVLYLPYVEAVKGTKEWLLY